MKTVSSEDIRSGDMIKLGKYDVAPCDIVIISSSEHVDGNYFCNIDQFYSHGVLKRSTKQCLNSTTPGNRSLTDNDSLNKYLKTINGRLEILKIPENLKSEESFDGFFKAKNDPKKEEINIQN